MHLTTLNRIIDNDGADLEGCFSEWLKCKQRFGHRKNKEDNSNMNNTKLLRNKWYARAMNLSEETLNKYKADIMNKRGMLDTTLSVAFVWLPAKPHPAPTLNSGLWRRTRASL
jgi:hypothetical protein